MPFGGETIKNIESDKPARSAEAEARVKVEAQVVKAKLAGVFEKFIKAMGQEEGVREFSERVAPFMRKIQKMFQGSYMDYALYHVLAGVPVDQLPPTSHFDFSGGYSIERFIDNDLVEQGTVSVTPPTNATFKAKSHYGDVRPEKENLEGLEAVSAKEIGVCEYCRKPFRGKVGEVGFCPNKNCGGKGKELTKISFGWTKDSLRGKPILFLGPKGAWVTVEPSPGTEFQLNVFNSEGVLESVKAYY